MSESEKPKTVSNAFHGEGDADTGVVTESVVARDKADEAGGDAKQPGGSGDASVDRVEKNDEVEPGP